MKITNILAVDPSFSRTGVAYIAPDGKMKYKSISRSGKNYQIDVCLQHASEEALELKEFIIKQGVKDAVLIYEYPAMASRSGAILAVLMAKFDSLFRALLKAGILKEVYYVPPTAVSSHTGILTTNKTAVVEFATKLTSDRVNHDVATAVILCDILSEIVLGSYKKSYFKVQSPEDTKKSK